MNNYLEHHGIKGQKWGVRRFEKKSGGLTAAGKKRYIDYKEGIVSRQERKTPGHILKDGYDPSIQKRVDRLTGRDTLDRLNKKSKDAMKEAVSGAAKSGVNKVFQKKEKQL